MKLPNTARFWLRLEGIAALAAGIALFQQIGGNFLWLIPLLVLPDISMVGFLRGPALGAFTYNLIHNFAVALLALGAGVALNIPALAVTGAILVAHTGMDRALGFGIRYSDDPKRSHLQRA